MKRRWGERAERYLLEQSSLATNNNHRDLWAWRRRPRGQGHALVELVVTSVAVLRLIRLGEAGVERRGFDLYVKARKDEGQTEGRVPLGTGAGRKKALGKAKPRSPGFVRARSRAARVRTLMSAAGSSSTSATGSSTST
jgi:hypothetical protein